MASTHKSLRSSTANKRPTTSIADGQIALNTNTTSPGLFFKDSTGATIIKVGPVHVGTTAPNASPAAGGSSGNSTGEVWLDTSLTPNGVKIWNGASWTNATPIGSTTVQGLLELATNAETQTGTDPDRAVTPAGLQSKVSDSTSTTSSTTIASSTAVKSAYDLANAALPKSGGTVTGNLEIGTTGSLSFEGATADAFETTIAVVDPTADRTITLPDTTGTVVTTGDTGTVTSTMIADGTIVNGDINASAAIDHSKLANITAGSVLLGNASNVPTATALSGDVTVNSTGVTAISSGVIVNADVNASAAIAGTKISPDFGSQTVQTTGIFSHALGTAGAPTVTFTGDTNTGIYSPGADQVAISTGGSGRLFVSSTGNVGVGTNSPGAPLEVNGGDGLLIKGSSTDSFLQNYATSNNYIEFKDAGGSIGSIQYAHTDDSLRFKVNASERLRITSAGLVGVGVSDPGQVLVIGGGTNGRARMKVTSGAGNFGKFEFSTDSSSTASTAQIAEISASIVGTGPLTSSLTFATNSGNSLNNAMTIDSSQRVGIGTSSPGVKTHIYDASNVGLKVESGGANYTEFNLTNTSASYTIGIRPDVSNALVIRDANATANRVAIDTSGRVGIGTTTPSERLQVDGNILAGAGGQIMASSGAPQYGSRTANSVLFLVNNSEAARLDADKRLLVGTSSASGVNSNTAPVLAGNFVSFTGSVSANHNTATTLFTLENLNATYMVTAIITGTANATAYHAVYIIGSVVTNSHSIQALKAGSLLTLSLSGANVQATQGSGIAQTVTWSVTRMANL